MAITALSGPFLGYGITLTSTSGDGITGNNMENNGQRGPSLFDLSFGLLDPRQAYAYEPGGAVTNTVTGFYQGRGIVDYAPSSASSNAFAISSNTVPSAGAAITLTPSSAKGTYSTTIIAPETGLSVSVIAIDSTAASVAFGSDGTVTLWNPAGGAGRAILLATSSNLDAGGYTIAGRDMYGYKMTETIFSSAVTAGVKAFKYISSITASTTVTSTGVSIGLTDVFGFPMAVGYTGQNVSVSMSSGGLSGNGGVSIALSSANTILASTAATQTSTTPDVRGTFTSSLASNGSNRLQIHVLPPVSALASVTSTNVSGLFGATQFSSV